MVYWLYLLSTSFLDLFLPSMPLFANSKYFKIQELTLIDVFGVTFNYEHNACNGAKYYDHCQIIV